MGRETPDVVHEATGDALKCNPDRNPDGEGVDHRIYGTSFRKDLELVRAETGLDLRLATAAYPGPRP